MGRAPGAAVPLGLGSTRSAPVFLAAGAAAGAMATLILVRSSGLLVSDRSASPLASWIAAFILLAAAFALIWHARTLRLQSRRIEASIHRWSQGDLACRIDLDPGQTLTPLAESLDRMAESLDALRNSERRIAEDQIVEAEKLATTGRLAAGVAHEINNPLGGILLCADLLLETTPETDPRREQISRIVRQATRAKEIVKGLIDFARQSPPRIERLDLNRVLTDALGLLEQQPLYPRVRVVSELHPAPLRIEADPVKLQQVFVNILMNALEAMREGGTLILRSGFSERAGFCRVAVSDNGFGIAPEHLNRIFEPFFTTKEVGRGLGLGLAISHGIIHQHHGEIEVQTRVGHGTTVRVLLPLASEAE